MLRRGHFNALQQKLIGKGGQVRNLGSPLLQPLWGFLDESQAREISVQETATWRRPNDFSISFKDSLIATARVSHSRQAMTC